MGWLEIIGAAISLSSEILKLINDSRADQKEKTSEITKKKTETIQSIARGIIDRDSGRINDGFDRLRRLRENK